MSSSKMSTLYEPIRFYLIVIVGRTIIIKSEVFYFIIAYYFI